ncbi:MAG: hypothetical protein F9K18_08350 [Thermoanaerobaculia bacterium]|nr:MAG: hypothetical protein F9K18_08350 [Thermoanaerobaculia bacterium]
MSEPLPFSFKDSALITLALGRSAHSLRELRDRVTDVPPSSLLHHFVEGLLRPSFDDPEFRNDFALWARDELRDPVLAERLAVLDPFALPTDGETLRAELLDVLEDRLAEVARPEPVPPGHEFHFLRSQMVVFDTGLVARTPAELAARVGDLPRGSVFYHFVDARLRPPRGVDDFTHWLEGWGEATAAPRRRLAAIDPMFGTLAELRESIAAALAAAGGDA